MQTTYLSILSQHLQKDSVKAGMQLQNKCKRTSKILQILMFFLKKKFML